MNTLDEFLRSRNCRVYEGYTCQNLNLKKDLISIIPSDCKSIMEIGFNAGHSSELFLQNSDANVVSFDLGVHSYGSVGKEFIDDKYAGRHELIVGDSQKTVPEYTAAHPDKRFDLIFIDGGHEYSIAQADLMNCMRLASPRTLLIMDDIVHKKEWSADWTTGPTQAWQEALDSSRVVQAGHTDYGKGRGMSWGNYCIEQA